MYYEDFKILFNNGSENDDFPEVAEDLGEEFAGIINDDDDIEEQEKIEDDD